MYLSSAIRFYESSHIICGNPFRIAGKVGISFTIDLRTLALSHAASPISKKKTFYISYNLSITQGISLLGEEGGGEGGRGGEKNKRTE